MKSDSRIAALHANEILDSRGNPTLKVEVRLEDGTTGESAVPSGASTGEFEAVELRDGDPNRFGGMGVLKAIANLNTEIAQALKGVDAAEQRTIDDCLIALDGTESKSRLGANAILGASLACARAAAAAQQRPLYDYLGGPDARTLPVPMFNVLNGGKHATGGPDVQEFKIVPVGAPTFREAYRYGAEVYHALGKVLRDAHLSTNVGDEGGYVPKFESNVAALETIMIAIAAAGFRAGEDIAIGLDPAASSFFEGGAYCLERDGLTLGTDGMIDYWETWLDRFPIISLEDPLADSDWSGFRAMTRKLGQRVQIVGDDLFVTNCKFLQRGIEEGCCNSVLIKPNQIGTVTETLDTARMAHAAGYTCLVSHRSGETMDTSIADLAVAINSGQIKAGAPARGERVVKYNRLLEIEATLGSRAVYPGWQAFRRAEASMRGGCAR